MRGLYGSPRPTRRPQPAVAELLIRGVLLLVRSAEDRERGWPPPTAVASSYPLTAVFSFAPAENFGAFDAGI
jgi:hypothetical protein